MKRNMIVVPFSLLRGKEITDKVTDLIMSIINTGGIHNPLVVEPFGEVYNVLCGHHRLHALKNVLTCPMLSKEEKDRLTMVPVIICTEMTDGDREDMTAVHGI